MKTELIQLGNPRDTYGAILTEGIVLMRYECFGDKMAYLAVPFDGTLWCASAWQVRHAPDFWEADFYSTNMQPPVYVGMSFGEKVGELFHNFLKTEEAAEFALLKPKQVKGTEWLLKQKKFMRGLASM